MGTAAFNTGNNTGPTHGDFIPSLAPLVAARQQQGYTTSVVNIEDIYDEFTVAVVSMSRNACGLFSP